MGDRFIRQRNMRTADLQRDSSQCYAQPVLSFSKPSLQPPNLVLAKDTRHVSDEAEGPWVGFKFPVKDLRLENAVFAVLDKCQARAEEVPRDRARSRFEQLSELSFDLGYIVIKFSLLLLQIVAVLLRF